MHGKSAVVRALEGAVRTDEDDPLLGLGGALRRRRSSPMSSGLGTSSSWGAAEAMAGRGSLAREGGREGR